MCRSQVSTGNHRAGAMQEYEEAVAAERAAWAAVRGRHPERPGHDPTLWRTWLEAANRLGAAIVLMKREGSQAHCLQD